MGYQRGERGRLASLIKVVILGTAVVSIDHISGRSVRPSARSEAANQVISMNLATDTQADLVTPIKSSIQTGTLNQCRRHHARVTAENSCPESAPVTNSIKLKARELQDTDWPVLARLARVTRPPCLLELQVAAIPPLQKRLVAAASQVSSIRSVSIRIDGEIKINKAPVTAPPRFYLIRATSERDARIRERAASRAEPVLALPPQPAWK